MLTKIVFSIIIAAIAIFAGIFVVRKRPAAPPQPVTESNAPSIATDQPSVTGLTGSLIIVTKGGQIERVNLADSARRQLLKDDTLRLAKTAPGAKEIFTVTTATSSTANLNLYDPGSGKDRKAS
ncbi:hypothetical protein HYZ64_01515 [Candidatus Berkelbacteria bacterium]|nr:hypothetical protein [Candidatus Berkelbacteria bacterium]